MSHPTYVNGCFMTHRLFPDIAGSGAPRGNSGLFGLFDAESIALVRETVGKVTGLSVIVLDADGEEVTDSGATSSLCRRWRRDKFFSSLCKSSDKYGADHAFARQDRFVYFCPCGLVRAVIPMIVRGKYLGGFYIGQVRCDNAPQGTPRLERLLEPGGEAHVRGRQFREMLDATPTYDFSYFAYITETIAAVVSKIAAGESGKREKLAALEASAAALEERVHALERELDIRESALHHWKSRLNLEFLINGLNSVSSIAAIEDAPRAGEMCVLLADHLRHYLAGEKDFVRLREEIDMISGYLAMQKIRFGEALSFSVTVSEQAGKSRLPSRVLLPLVESAVLVGLASREEGFVLSLAATLEGSEVVIRIESNTPSASATDVALGSLPMQSGFDADGVSASLAIARARLRQLLGSRHDLRFADAPEDVFCVLRYVAPHMEGPA